MKVIFPSGNFRVERGGKVYKPGEPFTLSRERLRALMRAGHQFVPVSDDDALPEDPTLNLPTTREVVVEPGPEVNEAGTHNADTPE